MTSISDPPTEDVTLCLVVHNRNGNLANVLNSVNRLVGKMVVVDAGAGGTTVAHLASEYDARYIQLPADPDESALLNHALDKVDAPWVLFLHQEEVLHNDEPEVIIRQLRGTQCIAFDLPIINFSEPRSHHFELRLFRTDVGIKWHHQIYPTLNPSLQDAAKFRGIDTPTTVIASTAIVTLGEPEWEEWELRDALVRIERELDIESGKVRYWFHLAKVAILLEQWDRAHAAVEEGLNVVSQQPDVSHDYPNAVNGLIGMFCQTMLRSKHFPKNTVQSLLTIYNNMAGDARFGVPLGRLLLATGRDKDAIEVQRSAVEQFFTPRRYPLSYEDGLFKPVLFEWELAWQKSGDGLLKSVVAVQSLLGKYNFKLQPILEYIYEHHQNLFFEIQTVLQVNLKNFG